MRGVLANLLPYPNRFRLALFGAMLGRPFKPLAEKLPVIGRQLGAMLALAPKSAPSRSSMEGPAVFPPTGAPKGRVALLSGCAQPVLAPEINEAAIRVLGRLGIEVVLPKGEGCCGALVHHMGKEQASHAQARAQIDAWTAEIEARGADAILITASGCGTTVKDYGYMLRGDSAYADKAAKISELAKDITEFISEYDLGPPKRWSSLRVAYHSACSLQHGQRVTDEPKMLLKKAGYTVLEVPEGHICCGSAGTYNILQPELAGQLKARKQANIHSVKPDIVSAGNIGCITQLASGLNVPIAHTVELLDWAYGGPVPRGLDGLKSFMTDVPEAPRVVEDYIRT